MIEFKAPVTWIIKCGCGASSSTQAPAGLREFAVKRFIAKGWFVLRDGWSKRDGVVSANRCPNCETKSATKESPMTRSMTRADRRKIIEKLQDVYLNEITGYSPGYTDAKVATDLDVPRAWIAQVREEVFGPEKANDDIRASLVEAKDLLGSIKVAEEMFRELLTKAEKIERTIISIEDSLR